MAADVIGNNSRWRLQEVIPCVTAIRPFNWALQTYDEKSFAKLFRNGKQIVLIRAVSMEYNKNGRFFLRSLLPRLFKAGAGGWLRVARHIMHRQANIRMHAF